MAMGLAASGAVAAPGAASDTVFSLGRQGWILERFGSDVTILRTRPPLADEPAAAAMLLSCAATDRRFRLTLPAPRPPNREPGPVAPAVGSVLIRAFGSARSAQLSVATRLDVLDGRILAATNAERARSDDVVLAIGRMLLARVRGFDVLYHPGSTPPGLRRSTVHRLLLATDPGDAAAFQDFVRACATE